MAQNKTAVHAGEMVIPAQVLHGTPAEMTAELDLLVVGLLALRRTLATDARTPVVSLPDPEPSSATGPLDWMWRNLRGRVGAAAREAR